MKAGYLLVAVFVVTALGCQGRSNIPVVSNSATVQTTPAVSNALSAESVTIESGDKAVLVGSLYSAAKPNSPALLLLHQWQSDRHSYDDFAKQMQAKGFAVLSIDGRGFGESTKKSDGSSVAAGRTDADVKAMLGDVGAAYEFLAKQKNVDPAKIGIIGASYGSSLALIYAAGNPKVAAAALLSPGLNYFGNMPTEPAIQTYGDRPLYMLAAEDDKESADAVRKLTAIGNNAKYGQKIYPAGGHGTALLPAKIGGGGELERFFSDQIGPTKQNK